MYAINEYQHTVKLEDTNCYEIYKNMGYTIFEEIPDDVNAKIKAEAELYDALQYQRDRQYPSIGDQLDMQYWDQVNGTTTWKDAIAKVKSDNPKE